METNGQSPLNQTSKPSEKKMAAGILVSEQFKRKQV